MRQWKCNRILNEAAAKMAGSTGIPARDVVRECGCGANGFDMLPGHVPFTDSLDDMTDDTVVVIVVT